MKLLTFFSFLLAGCSPPVIGYIDVRVENCTVTPSVHPDAPGAKVSCPDGSSYVIPAFVGAPGPQGVSGTDGKDGTSCSVQRTEDGALITCTDGSSAFVADGTRDASIDGCDCKKPWKKRKQCRRD